MRDLWAILFLPHRDLNVAVYQRINTRPSFLWKIAHEQNYSTQRTGLGGNGFFALSNVLHTLTAMKPTNSVKSTPSTVISRATQP